MPAPVKAEESKSITFQTEPFDGLEYRLYRVGSMDGHDGYTLTDELSRYKINLFDKSAANTLKCYVTSDELDPLSIGVTDSNGQIVWDNLEEGAYLIVGDSYIKDGYEYTSNPVLLSLPTTDQGTGEMEWNLSVQSKDEKNPVSISKKLVVNKIWNDGESDSRPLRVTVKLLCNGKSADVENAEIVLNKDNNWSYTWKELDGSCEWSVIETDVPEGYRVSIEEGDSEVIIKNTSVTPDSPNPPSPSTPSKPGTPTKPSLPYTGQLWWPVGWLVCAGLLSLIIGVLLLRPRRS